MNKKSESLIVALAIVFSVAIGIIISLIDYRGIFSSSHSKKVYPLIILLLIIIFIVSVAVRHHKDITTIVYAGLAIRLIVLISIGFIGILPYTYDGIWDRLAGELLNDWNSGNFHISFESSSNVKYYTIFATSIYYVIGYNPLFMMMLNVLWGVLSIIVVYRIGKELFDGNVGKLAAAIFAFWPTHAMFSAMNMRDSLAIFLMSLFILILIKLMKNFRPSTLLLLALLFAANVLIRTQNAALLTILTVPFIVYHVIKHAHHYLKPVWIILGITGLITCFGLLYALDYSKYLNISYITREMDYRTDGGAAYLTSMKYGGWVDVIIYSPIRLVYFLFSPFPWQVKSLTQALSALEGIIVMWFTLVIIWKWKLVRKLSFNKTIIWTFILLCLLGMMSNAVIDSNSGTSMRHKLQFLYGIFILYASTKNYADVKKLEHSGNTVGTNCAIIRK